MLKFRSVAINLANLANRNVYFRTAEKAKKDLYGTFSTNPEILGVSKAADPK
jgi:hypothetical protein